MSTTRDTVFISKATPGDDEFVLWLAPRLEAAGYKVFADVLTLQAGDRWRKQVTGTLQNAAVKMLLCCRDSTLAKEGVQEEIGIALDVAKEIPDPRFIIPLRLERYKKVFGIGELQYEDFLGGWAAGLRDLLESLQRQHVPRVGKVSINPSWESYKARLAIKVQQSPEVLTSNWLGIKQTPASIYYYQPTGAVDHAVLERACRDAPFPTSYHQYGFFSFATPNEVTRSFENVGRFTPQSTRRLAAFLQRGSKPQDVWPRDAQNIVSAMFRSGWERLLRTKGFSEYAYSKQLGFHAHEQQVPIGKRIAWGRAEERRSSVLCNVAGGKVWQFGVSAAPHFWPFPHFRLKARVLFAELASGRTGEVIRDSDEQHRLRRKICKGWRNKAWHGRLMAYLALLASGAPSIDVPMSESIAIRVDVRPMLVTVPVTTALPNVMSEEIEEQDSSTLGNLDVEEGGVE